MAEVIPFPLTRRQAFIDRLASRVADLNRDAGERHLVHQLEVQAGAMRRKGVREDVIARELRGMEGAVRASLWRLLAVQGGAA